MSNLAIEKLEGRMLLSTITIAPPQPELESGTTGTLHVNQGDLSLANWDAWKAKDNALFSRGKLKLSLVAFNGTFGDKTTFHVGGQPITNIARQLKATVRDDRLNVYALSTTNSGELIPSRPSQKLIAVNLAKVQVIEIYLGIQGGVSTVDGPQLTQLTIDRSFPAATIYLNEMNTRLVANDQPNTIYGGSGDDTIYAGGGDDVVYGDEGSDRLFGEGGNDTIFGGAHKDFLSGGSGKNILVGGSGTDYFTIRPKDKTDREPRDHVTVIG